MLKQKKEESRKEVEEKELEKHLIKKAITNNQRIREEKLKILHVQN